MTVDWPYLLKKTKSYNQQPWINFRRISIVEDYKLEIECYN